MKGSKPDVDDNKIVFRKVSEAMNRDERYLALSPIPPCGRGLWHHLLFGSHTTALPGLAAVGRLAMAEDLGWEIGEFDAAFAEIEQQGLAQADWKSRVVWLPNALKHNLPQSPNVVRSWRGIWHRIPDCELKLTAYEAMRSSLKAYSEPFAKAFVEHCEKPSPKTCVTTSPKPQAMPKAKPNQEAGSREQEAEGPSHDKGRSQSGEVVELPPRTHARDGVAR